MHSYNQALVVDSWSASWILISIQFCSSCPKLVYIYSHASKDNQTCLHIQFIFTRLQGQNSPFYEIPKRWQCVRLASESPYSTGTDLADHFSNFRKSVLFCFEDFVKVADEFFIFPWNSFQDWLPYSKQLGDHEGFRESHDGWRTVRVRVDLMMVGYDPRKLQCRWLMRDRSRTKGGPRWILTGRVRVEASVTKSNFHIPTCEPLGTSYTTEKLYT